MSAERPTEMIRDSSALERAVTVIDRLSTATGWLAGWLIVPLTLAVAYEVAARYGFNAPTRWASTATYDQGGI